MTSLITQDPPKHTLLVSITLIASLVFCHMNGLRNLTFPSPSIFRSSFHLSIRTLLQFIQHTNPWSSSRSLSLHFNIQFCNWSVVFIFLLSLSFIELLELYILPACNWLRFINWKLKWYLSIYVFPCAAPVSLRQCLQLHWKISQNMWVIHEHTYITNYKSV